MITYIIVPIILFLTFCLTFYFSNKIAERRKILVNMILLDSIIIIIATSITIGLCFAISNFDYIVIISSFIWGFSCGLMGGLINYKYKYKKIYRHQGL